MTRPLGKREQTKASNRAAILDAGRAVFGELGYGAASVRDIIRRTELAAGTFYNYFPDKESIFVALVEEISAEALVRVRAARQRARDAEEFVREGFRAYFEFIVEDPVRFAFMSRNTGTIRAEFDDVALPQSNQELEEDLHAAIAAGTMAPVDVEYVAHSMTAVGVELGVRLMERDPPDVDGATDFVTELFLGGLDRMARRPRG